jgi:hypothetical protein
MTEPTEPTTPRGTPPNQKQLGRDLGARVALWDAVVDMGKEFGAAWRWVHSEATGAWTLRAYLPGDRFFLALSLVDGAIEASLNLKAEEWDYVAGEGPTEGAYLDGLRDQALASGKEPAWLHVPIVDKASLPMLAKLLFARGRRIEQPRSKPKSRKRR